MSNQILLISIIFIETFFWYFYFSTKTKLNLKFVIFDSIIVFFVSSIFCCYALKWLNLYVILLSPFIVLALSFLITMIRFWRVPKRKINKNKNVIISPADGQIIYIKNIKKGQLPFSVKDKRISKLFEITKTEFFIEPCWLIGINMTPLDVHKNSAPIEGEIILSKHTSGKFLSLKSGLSEVENERHTYIIKNERLMVGVIQIASRLVRRIDAYVKEGDIVEKGQWIGMIRFGSQVDVILPDKCSILVAVGQQVYASETVLAKI